jgi:ribosome-binding factor A
LKGLQSSAGFLQQKVAKRIDTRYTPVLRFELDMGVKKSISIAKTLSEVLPEDESLDDDEGESSEFDDLADEWAEDDETSENR